MSPHQIIVLAMPVFLALIALEWVWSRMRRQPTYHLSDTLQSLGLGVLSQIAAVFVPLLRVGVYAALFEWVNLTGWTEFWLSPLGWVLALVFYDFCYYWLHRAGHEVALFWAAHVVHHHSQDYNLGTALRQTTTGLLTGWVFYLPMALAGVPPLVFGAVAMIDLLYQFWVHTEHVPRLGWFDRWFCSPSNHRVHHAVNDGYLDRNYGGILMVWDRMFGSFTEEREPCVYGTRTPLESWDPLWANLEVYVTLARLSWRTRRWGDKLRVWFKPPGWLPPDLALSENKPPFALSQVRRFDPPLSLAVRWAAVAKFVVLLGGTAVFLWQAEGWPLSRGLVGLATLTLGLWTLGALTQGRLSLTMSLAIDAAALATATATLGLPTLYAVFKPLAMALCVMAIGLQNGVNTERKRWLMVTLALCGVGDVFLLSDAGFLGGLAAFLLAHLTYVRLYTRDAPWFPDRRALAVCLLYAAAMFAVLWNLGLPAGMRAPVAVYALAIACMGAQALGRASVLGTPSSRWVAAGAVVFMVSDSVLAWNRFVSPLPLPSLWVLSTYYTGQFMIARHVLDDTPALSR